MGLDSVTSRVQGRQRRSSLSVCREKAVKASQSWQWADNTQETGVGIMFPLENNVYKDIEKLRDH